MMETLKEPGTVRERAEDFLAQRRIAVVGVSRTREEAANGIYRKLRGAGYEVFAVNPHADTFDGDPCYPDLASLPERVDGVVIVTRPEVTEEIVQDCIRLGVPRVWMHGMMGTRPPRPFAKIAASVTSVSDAAAQACRDHGITVIPGACPMMFCTPVDVAHRCMRGFLGMTGGLG